VQFQSPEAISAPFEQNSSVHGRKRFRRAASRFAFFTENTSREALHGASINLAVLNAALATL
jgi:hypothetical protein